MGVAWPEVETVVGRFTERLVWGGGELLNCLFSG